MMAGESTPPTAGSADRMARARSAVQVDRAKDYQTARQRLAALPSVDELGPEAIADGELCTVAEAAKVTGLSQQAIRQWLDRQAIPCWRDGHGHRVFLTAALDDTQAAQRQAAEQAARDLAQATHETRRDNPLTDEFPKDRCSGPDYAMCPTCRRGLDL
jgi:excisionase family DNA binding protein